MNRDDLISKRARAYAYAELAKIGSNQTIWFTAPLFDSEDLQSAYLQGSKDAEDSPAWRMCEDEIPTDPHQPYWVYAKCCGECCVAYLQEKTNIFYDEGGEELSGVVAWLPLPKFYTKNKEIMKDRLTTGQSQRLIELGVAPNKASGEKVFVDIHPEALKGNADYAKPWGFIPTFTLSDILSLLPKEIKHKGDPYGLDINWDDSWSASYFNAVNFVIPNKEGSIAFEQAPELIDALFELLCWVLKTHPDKIKKL